MRLEPTNFVSEQYCYHALTSSAMSARCKNKRVASPSLAAESWLAVRLGKLMNFKYVLTSNSTNVSVSLVDIQSVPG